MDNTTGNIPPGGKSVALPGRRLEAVHCLLIPLHEETMLLPNAAVAEVIAYSEPETIPDAPDWLMGWLAWRDRKVPLISFEAASGRVIPDDFQGSRIAVLNTLNSNPRVPYIALLIQDIPKLHLVQPDSITERDDAEPRQSIAGQLLADGEPVLVPDLDDLELRVERLRSQ
jgi:chemosensory pili system protein ChpC